MSVLPTSFQNLVNFAVQSRLFDSKIKQVAVGAAALHLAISFSAVAWKGIQGEYKGDGYKEAFKHAFRDLIAQLSLRTAINKVRELFKNTPRQEPAKPLTLKVVNFDVSSVGEMSYRLRTGEIQGSTIISDVSSWEHCEEQYRSQMKKDIPEIINKFAPDLILMHSLVGGEEDAGEHAKLFEILKKNNYAISTNGEDPAIAYKAAAFVPANSRGVTRHSAYYVDLLHTATNSKIRAVSAGDKNLQDEIEDVKAESDFTTIFGVVTRRTPGQGDEVWDPESLAPLTSQGFVRDRAENDVEHPTTITNRNILLATNDRLLKKYDHICVKAENKNVQVNRKIIEGINNPDLLPDKIFHHTMSSHLPVLAEVIVK